MENQPVNEDLYKKFLDWWVRPKEERKVNGLPLDIGEFCERHDANKAEIASFINVSSFQQDVYDASVAWAKLQAPKIFHQLYRNVASTADHRDAKAFLQLIIDSDKAKKQDSSPTFNFNFNIDDNQYRQILERETKRVLTEGSAEQAPELLTTGE